MMHISYSARSHVGHIRENNQDNIYTEGVIMTPEMSTHPFVIDGITDIPAIFAVCDGMGGEDNGDVASLLAVQTLQNNCHHIKSAKPSQIYAYVQSYVNAVNHTIHKIASVSGKRMGTTLALTVATETGFYCYNIGDTRIYCLQGGNFNQITRDHTLFAEKGISKNKLTRCIGIGEAPAVDFYPCIHGKCRVMICSDGLTDMISRIEIENVLRGADRIEEAANALLALALGYGGNDNISVIILDITKAKTNFVSSVVNKIRVRRNK